MFLLRIANEFKTTILGITSGSFYVAATLYRPGFAPGSFKQVTWLDWAVGISLLLLGIAAK